MISFACCTPLLIKIEQNNCEWVARKYNKTVVQICEKTKTCLGAEFPNLRMANDIRFNVRQFSCQYREKNTAEWKKYPNDVNMVHKIESDINKDLRFFEMILLLVSELYSKYEKEL